MLSEEDAPKVDLTDPDAKEVPGGAWWGKMVGVMSVLSLFWKAFPGEELENVGDS